MVTAWCRLPQGAQAAPAARLCSGSRAGAGGRTQEVGVTFSDGLPCKVPSGPALGRDPVSAPRKAQRKPRCARAEVALALALHWSAVMGNAPNAVLPRGDPRPRPLWYAQGLLAIAADSFMPIFKLVILSLHWLNICLVPCGE